MSAEANHWQRLRSAYRQVTALASEEERTALLALLRERDPKLTAELEELLEHTDDRIDAILAASARDFLAHAGHVAPDVRRLARIVQVLCAVRRARAHAEPTESDAGPKGRLAR
jgi:hypothetical protein